MVHKPKHRVHSFRGLLGDGGEDEINLERQNVNLAYRIIKFQAMGITENETYETTLKIYRESQTSIDSIVDFSDQDLLGAILYGDTGGASIFSNQSIIFDNVLFSRNIYVTNKSIAAASAMNYYIELEEVPVGAATLMQLKLGVARKLNLKEGEYIPPD